MQKCFSVMQSFFRRNVTNQHIAVIITTIPVVVPVFYFSTLTAVLTTATYLM